MYEDVKMNSMQYKQIPVKRHRKKRRRRLKALAFLAITIVACVKFWSMLSLNLNGLTHLGTGTGNWFFGGNTEEGESASELAKTLSRDEYPESPIELLERNPETKQFVMDYPEKKDFSGKIDVSGRLQRGNSVFYAVG